MKRSEIKRRPLADSILAGLEPEATAYREHDGAGLYFVVKPGGRKAWELRYKKPATGKWSWIGLGAYPEVSGALARQRAAELKRQAAGDDLHAVKHASRNAEAIAAKSTFEALGREWFEARRHGWEPGTAKRIIGALELHVFPVFGRRPHQDISAMEWMELFRRLEAKGIVYQMGNVRRYCKEAYDLAKVTGRAVQNPIDGLGRFLKPHTKENHAHVGAGELPDLLRAIAAYPHAHDVRLGLRLLVLTGVRPSELREAPWAEFDMEAALWVIPAARMKKRREHVVPLSRQALEALAQLHRLNGAYPLLFPGRNDRKTARSNMVFNMALRRMGYEGRQTGHGFRHIASTILREHGFPREHVEAQLSHAEGGVAGVYNKATYLEQRRAMMQWYADHLDALENGAAS